MATLAFNELLNFILDINLKTFTSFKNLFEPFKNFQNFKIFFLSTTVKPPYSGHPI